MLHIWLLIIFGVTIVPLISSLTKKLEKKVKKMKKGKKEDIKILFFSIKDEEEIETLIKFLTYFLIALFIFIVIMMIRFTSQLVLES